jgi:hypothetical protein
MLPLWLLSLFRLQELFHACRAALLPLIRLLSLAAAEAAATSGGSDQRAASSSGSSKWRHRHGSTGHCAENSSQDFRHLRHCIPLVVAQIISER